MFYLSRLEIENFRSFKEKAIIDFPDSGAVLVSGRYKNENISSGSGKSSILMGLAYALGFGDLPATELKNWNSKNLNVKVVLKNDSQVIEIIRDPKLKLLTDGQEHLGTSAQEKLNSLLKVCPDFLKILTYRPQREPGSFLKAPDSEKKNLLKQMLQLSEIDDAHDKIKTEYQNKKNSLDLLQRELEFLNLSANEWTIDQNEYDRLSELHFKYTTELEKIKNNKKLFENTQKINKIREQLTGVNLKLNEISVKKQQILDYEGRIKTIKSEIEIMEKEKCPTCFQYWEKGFSAAEAKKNTINMLSSQIKENNLYIEQERLIRQDLNSLTNEYEKLSIETSSESIKAKELLEKLSITKNNLKNLTEQKNRLDKVFSDIQKKEIEKNELDKDLPKYEHALNILSNQGFMGYIFDELLMELETKVNQLISTIPNINSFSVSINSTETSKTGKVKNSINIKLQKLGKEMQIKNLSGGQICALELCFDLAISQIIRNRSGVKFNWICLDEAMDGLDIETKRSAIETIKSNINGLVVIVDHSTEIKESFEKIINIEFDGKNSYII